eukprot:CAMPEP_0177772036 /NCGR_PEP_ID=MMETSP0491_2-20121128/11979_1 /TAXON_ID=63592 /ORGANISM="Tetraselmis chuii, Strain PLY429" /LENGTH=59 /DNA_ID=CAMNT_0019289761 /DNA_START=317 /DNA_END=496 /DNA_ORIENTATION=-
MTGGLLANRGQPSEFKKLLTVSISHDCAAYWAQLASFQPFKDACQMEVVLALCHDHRII